MAETRRYALNAQLDIEQILSEAQHRWLRPAEICEILQNYKNFQIAPEPPNRPPSGSLFLFDRKVLRYFRKDGHSWRKKKDGKTVKEAHERLKAGSVDVLHCYYAHGEDNENFQRRSYWMLEEELSHIVLVHYREVKGNRTNFSRLRDTGVVSDSQQIEENTSKSEIDGSVGSKYQPYDYQGASPVTDTTSLNSSQAAEYEDVESAYQHQTSPGFQSIPEFQSPVIQKMEGGSIPYYPVLTSNNHQGQFPGMSFGSITQGENDKNPVNNGLTYELDIDLELRSWETVGGSSAAGYGSVNFQPLLPITQASTASMMHGQENELLGKVFTSAFGKREDFGSHSDDLATWQTSERDFMHISKWSADQKSHLSSLYDLGTKLNEVHQVELGDSAALGNTYLPEQSRHPMPSDLHVPALNAVGNSLTSESDVSLEGKTNYLTLKQPLLDGVRKESLKKLDSFDRWMTKELGDVTETQMQPGSAAYWETVGAEDGVDDSGISTHVSMENYLLGPSLSQDQLFSILDFSPNWANARSEIEVLIMGRFLRSQEEVGKHKWACMFGELEVPIEIFPNGVLRCYTPVHETGRVPFYITCSNRLACSEVREFEFRTSTVQDVDLADVGNIGSGETLLHMRFGKLLSLGPVTPQTSVQSTAETSHLCSKINALLKDDTEWEQMLYVTKQDEYSEDKGKDKLLQKLLKEKLHHWLLQKVTEGGKGPSVLDEEGQGVLHFAAALGYDWAIPPTIAAGVSVNFRDTNGWTALHWAAHFGRERTVAFLIYRGAAPGALTDPTPLYPSGRTPADLASSNGHKGIAGYLAESSLSSHLSSLQLDKEGHSGVTEVETVSERIATPVGFGDLPQRLSLKDTLAAVRNATQAAARIHQVFRVQSFQRKQLKEYGDDEFGVSDERALSLLARKSHKAGQHNEPVHAAAVRIQNKFRSWKSRKDFLLIRQRIIKIQAHVRGHQVRKNYKKIVWSVGILDKVILRWRRKGRGLSGFKPEALTAGTSMQEAEAKEDDYDFLKEGRKQTEVRLQKALARVKSMVQYPEAQDQYRRLLNVVSEMQETKAAYDKVLNNPEVDFDDDLIDLDALLEDDTFMPTTS